MPIPPTKRTSGRRAAGAADQPQQWPDGLAGAERAVLNSCQFPVASFH
jgi:hypothetical protein